jgi:hypothetical protein
MLAKMMSFMQVAAEKKDIILASMINKYPVRLTSLGLYNTQGEKN